MNRATQKRDAARRRNAKMRATPAYTQEEWEALRSVLKWCMRCGAESNLTKDHIIPIAKGGQNTLDNLQILCYSCNKLKAAKPLPRSTTQYLLPSQQHALDSLPEHLKQRIHEALHNV